MGDSIQQWRCSIGSFSPLSFKTSTSTCQGSSSSSLPRPNRWPLLILLILTSSVYSCSVVYCIKSAQSTSPMPASSCSWPCTTSSSAGFPSSPPPRPISSTYYFRCITNFEAKCTYGNRNKGIKIAHWNKGGAFLINKMPDVQNVIQQHHPHILGLSEANLLDTHDQNIVAIPDYTLHVCPTIDNPALRTSRVVVYTHKDVIVKIRPEFMSTNYSSIWLEVGLPNHRKFLVCQTYREWQYSN